MIFADWIGDRRLFTVVILMILGADVLNKPAPKKRALSSWRRRKVGKVKDSRQKRSLGIFLHFLDALRLAYPLSRSVG